MSEDPIVTRLTSQRMFPTDNHYPQLSFGYIIIDLIPELF